MGKSEAGLRARHTESESRRIASGVGQNPKLQVSKVGRRAKRAFATRHLAHETIDALYKMMQNKRGGANVVAARFITGSRLTRARRGIGLTAHARRAEASGTRIPKSRTRETATLKGCDLRQ